VPARTATIGRGVRAATTATSNSSAPRRSFRLSFPAGERNPPCCNLRSTFGIEKEEELIKLAASNINVVAITGNLTKDPELRSTPSGTSVCKLRVAVNSRRKDGQSGEWIDKPNYFDVTVWGAQGENCANYLSKGRPVAVEGRLDWREWEAQDGSKRQAVEIIANSVQFLGSRSDNAGGGGGNGTFKPSSDVPADTSDFEGATVSSGGGTDDDIPF
jgi:single-strand DNA-binding protein